jgi:hypothetical protein
VKHSNANENKEPYLAGHSGKCCSTAGDLLDVPRILPLAIIIFSSLLLSSADRCIMWNLGKLQVVPAGSSVASLLRGWHLAGCDEISTSSWKSRKRRPTAQLVAP